MGRKIRTTVPQARKQLTPSWPYLSQFKKANCQFKDKQKRDFDKRHRVRNQSNIPDGSEVVVTTESRPVEGRVVQPAQTPRSYIVETPSGELRRNRGQLNIVPDHSTASSASASDTSADSIPSNRTQTDKYKLNRESQLGPKLEPPSHPRTILGGRCGEIHVFPVPVNICGLINSIRTEFLTCPCGRFLI